MIIHNAFLITAQRAQQRAKETGERTGQALFNNLHPDLSRLVVGTSFDPFFKEMTFFEMIHWLDNHLIIEDNGRILAVFHGERILWEEDIN